MKNLYLLLVRIQLQARRWMLSLLLSISLLPSAYAQGSPDVLWMTPGGANGAHLAYSPDGQTLAWAGGTEIKIFSAVSGTLIRTISSGHTYEITSIAVSPDGRFLVSGSKDWRIKIWNLQTGLLTRTISGHGSWVNAVAFNPDGSLIASGSDDRTVRLWDSQSGALARTFNITSEMFGSHAVSFSPDGLTISSVGEGGYLNVWNVITGILLVHSNTGWGRESTVFSKDSLKFASTLFGQKCIVNESHSGSLLYPPLWHVGTVRALAFSPDGSALASGCGYYFETPDNALRLWDAGTGILVRNIDIGGGISALAYSPDGSKIVLSGGQLVMIQNPLSLTPITGTILLDDYSGDLTVPTLSFTLKNSSGVEVDSWSQQLDATGKFTHSAPMNSGGSYHLQAKVINGHWLSNSTTVTTGSAPYAWLFLRNGDCNGDNVVDLTDYTIVIEAFDSLEGDGKWNPQADLNEDGAIDLTDYVLVLLNFNAVGD